MRVEIPPPGPALSFTDWSAAIVAGLRAYLPEARAARKGTREVIVRLGDRVVHLIDDGSSFWIRFSTSGAVATTMASLFDTRRDALTVRNFSKTIAGFFDAQFTGA